MMTTPTVSSLQVEGFFDAATATVSYLVLDRTTPDAIPNVSLVANTLQQANFIHYSRGHIEILNLDGLSTTSCECYATVKAQYNRLLQTR